MTEKWANTTFPFHTRQHGEVMGRKGLMREKVQSEGEEWINEEESIRLPFEMHDSLVTFAVFQVELACALGYRRTQVTWTLWRYQ